MLVRCPDCGARYEIDGSLIPPRGRRVQCSACNHVWQQAPASEEDQDLAFPPEEEEPPRERPPLAADVKAILREEADRESRVRRERGLVDLRTDPIAGAGASGKPRPRAPAAPLPEADKVNATLRAASERAAEVHGHRRPGRRGFAAGLVVGLVLVGLAAAVYVTAPRIAETVPEAEPGLDRYVAAVDDLRVTLNRTADRAVAAVSDLLPPEG